MKRIGGTIDETPIAQQALEEDRVVEVGVLGGGDGDLTDHVPARYAELPESVTDLHPDLRARRWLGVIFADREGEDYPLDDGERETMMTLGRLAALTASVEHSTEQRESERRLPRTGRADPRPARERDPAAVRRRPRARLRGGTLQGRERQPLPGGAALGRRRPAPRPDPAARDPGAPLPRPVSANCSTAWSSAAPSCTSSGPRGSRCRPTWSRSPSWSSTRPSATSTATPRPTAIEVRVASDGETFTLQVENDGAGDGRTTRGSGLGLRLAALEALRYEGLVEFGSFDGDRWRVRLVVPVGAERWTSR